MKSDAFGGNPAPTPSTPNASPPADAVNKPAAQTTQSAANPPPAPVAPAPAAPANPPPAPTSSAPAQTPAAPAQTGHMPKVGTVTAQNPTGDPSLNNDGTPKVGDNSGALDEKRKVLNETVAKLGQVSGAGANSRGELAVILCQAARDGVITFGKKSTDVSDIYTLFHKSQSDAQIDDKHLDKVKADNQSAFNSQVSKLGIFVKLGAVETKHDTARLLAKAREVIPTIKNAKVSTFDALRMVAKAQLAAFKKDDKAKPLTVADMKTLLSPVENDPDDYTDAEYELSEVEAIVKRMMRLQDGTDDKPMRPSDELQRAIAIMGSLKARVAAVVQKENGGDDKADAPAGSKPA